MKFLRFLLFFILFYFCGSFGSLSSRQAQISNPGFHIKQYELEIKFDKISNQLSVHCIIKGIFNKNITRISFLLNNLFTIEELELNGTEMKPVSKKLDNDMIQTYLRYVIAKIIVLRRTSLVSSGRPENSIKT